MARARFGARVIENPNRLAEWGVKEAMLRCDGRRLSSSLRPTTSSSAATGSTASLRRFERDAALAAAFGRLVSGTDDPPLNKYVELIQSEPLNWFLNRILDDVPSRRARPMRTARRFRGRPVVRSFGGRTGSRSVRSGRGRCGCARVCRRYRCVPRASGCGHGHRVAYFPQARTATTTRSLDSRRHAPEVAPEQPAAPR